MPNEFRAFLSKKGSNRAIDSSYYELVSYLFIEGMWNCEVLTLGFQLGEATSKLLFRPIDRKKPIVMAIRGVGVGGCEFIYIDSHLPFKPFNRMINFKAHKSSDYMIDCHDGTGIGSRFNAEYWALRTRIGTFAFAKKNKFPGAYMVPKVDLLCAVIGGGIKPEELVGVSERILSEQERELFRQQGVRRIIDESETLRSELYKEKDALYGTRSFRFRAALGELVKGKWPLMWRASLKTVLDRPYGEFGI